MSCPTPYSRQFDCSFGGTGCSLGRVISDFADIVFGRVEMQLMKRQRIVIAFIVFVFFLSSILAVTHGNFSIRQSVATLETPPPLPTPPPSQIQVTSPLDNYTYGIYNGPENNTSDETANQATRSLILPLNITVNKETSKISYSLDGAHNITFNENTTAALTLGYGVHNLTVYASSTEGVTTESTITFTVGFIYPPINKMTMEQVQEATCYFESRGLSVQVDTVDESKWQNLGHFLYAGSVDATSKENFADAVIAHGMDTVWFRQESGIVSFYADYYNHSPLPIVYVYSATLV